MAHSMNAMPRLPRKKDVELAVEQRKQRDHREYGEDEVMRGAGSRPRRARSRQMKTIPSQR